MSTYYKKQVINILIHLIFIYIWPLSVHLLSFAKTKNCTKHCKHTFICAERYFGSNLSQTFPSSQSTILGI